jgi:DNA transposition AAA+ family ATPase
VDPTPPQSGNGSSLPGALRAAPRFNIGRDALNKALTHLPEEHSELLAWFWSYCRDNNWGRDRMGKLVAKANGEFYSADSIYQLLTGRRMADGANIDPMMRAIALLRRNVEPSVRTEGFVVTRLARKIWDYCDRAVKLRRIGFVFGDMCIGKSFALEEYAKRHRGRAIYVRMPTRGQLGDFLRECARVLAMGDRQTVNDLHDKVIDAFRPGMLLLVDEADQCFYSIRNTWGLATLDFLRELWDRTGCPIVLCMDHHGRDTLLKGAPSKRLKRLWRRRLPRLQMPAIPSRGDLNAFARSVGLDPAPDEKLTVHTKFIDGDGEEKTKAYTDTPAQLQHDVITSDGLGVWMMLLQQARETAAEQKRTIHWRAVLKAYSEFTADEDRDGSEDDEEEAQ